MSCGSWYPKGQHRLSESLDSVRFLDDRLFWRDSVPQTSPPHNVIPYAFKPHAFLEARRQGYKSVLWVDSAVWAIKSLDPMFEYIEKEGYLLFRNGWSSGEWCSDAALKPLGITREESFAYPHLMACVMGLNFDDDKANAFLDEWVALANDGITFLGDWNNDKQQVSSDSRVLGHRHDQTAASIVAYRSGMRNWLIPHETFLLYHSDGCVPKDTVCLLTRGM